MENIEGLDAREVCIDIKSSKLIEDLIAKNIRLFAHIHSFVKPFSIDEWKHFGVGIGPKSVFPVGVLFLPAFLPGEIFLRKGTS